MKYIIDIPDEAIDFMGGHISIFVEPVFKTGDCKRYALRLSKEDIEPYTEPDRKAIEDEVWSLAREIAYCMSLQECIDAGMLHDDDIYDSASGVLEKLTYQEAKSKYETWKKSKDEIRVGDEIKIKGSSCADAVVIGMDDYDLFIVWKDGETDRIEPLERKQWVKTGKHFNEVEELLKKITEESNED